MLKLPILCVGLVIGAPTSALAGSPTLVVMDLVAERGIDPSVVRLLNELLLTQFSRSGKYQVVGGSDIRAILSNEQQKLMLGGCADTACLAELGGALGADVLAVSNIGRIGDFYLLNVKILDVTTAQVVARWSEQVEGLENKLMTAVRKSVDKVTANEGAAPDHETAQTAQADDEPVPVLGTTESGIGTPGVLPVSLWAASGASAIAGIVSGVLAKAHYDNASNQEHVGGQKEISAGKTTQVVANVSYGLAGAFAATGLIVWLLSDDGAPKAAVAPTLGASGLITSVEINF